MLSSYFSNIRRTQLDQSSSVQPVSDFRWGTLSVTESEQTNEQTEEILVSNVGCSVVQFCATQLLVLYVSMFLILVH